MEIKTSWHDFLHQKGTLEIVWGVLVIMILLIGNMIVWTERDRLLREDIEFQPPQLLVLQRLLYNPAQGGVEPVSVGQSFDDFAVQTDKKGVKNLIHSEPNYTAVAGSIYHYQVHLHNRTVDARFQLVKGPEGMSLDPVSGLLTWETKGLSQKKYAVEVYVINENGEGSRQAFDIYLSKWFHPFGTIQRGRDLLSGLILGCSWILWPGLVAVLISILVGVSFGGYAGYYGGRVDAFLSFFTGLIGTFPALLLLFLAGAVFHFKIYPIMMVVGLIGFPRVAAAIRNKVVQMKNMDFIEAARELGLEDQTILWKDIIWYNARPLIMTYISYGFAFAVLIEVTLSYLNLHIPVNSVSWGGMLIEGRRMLSYNFYWPIFFPLMAIILTVFGFYALADGVTRRLKVKND